MLMICRDRGWISSDDLGFNDNYYLYTSHWFRTISPFENKTDKVHVVMIGMSGDVRSNSVEVSILMEYFGGGVQKVSQKDFLL